MSATLRSRADVVTDGATGQVVVGDGVITLVASATDTAGVEHVLCSHLVRFGARDGLAVIWQRS